MVPHSAESIHRAVSAGLSEEEALDQLEYEQLCLHIAGARGERIREKCRARIQAGTAPAFVARALAWYDDVYTGRWREQWERHAGTAR